MTPTAHRLYYIDSLRALAAISIVVFHLRVIAEGGPLPLPEAIQPFIYWVLGSGVTLFFVISAFLLSMLAPSYQKSPKPVLTFYIKRFFRIAPLFYLVIILWSFQVRIPLSTSLALNVTFVFNFFQTSQGSVVFAGWTIGVEMLFYLIFPLLHQWLPSLRAKMVALVALLILSLIANACIDSFLQWPLEEKSRYKEMTIFRHLPTFMIGMIAFDLFEMWDKSAHKRAISTTLIVSCISIFVILTKCSVTLVDTAYIQAVACAALLLAMGLHPFPGINALPAYLGKISYSIYLLHGLIIVKMGGVFSLIYKSGLPDAACFVMAAVIALALIIPISAATYYCIEQPGNYLGRKLVTWVETRQMKAWGM